MKALVTGGAGFIGSHLVERLVQEGIEVRVLDNFSTGRPENLAAVVSRIELVEGDICDYRVVYEAMRSVEVVFHQAALCSVARSVEEPQNTNTVNIGGTLNVLLAARDEKVRRVVYASSSSVYGDTRALPKQEAQTPTPASPYAVTKLAGELYCRTFYQLFGLETFSLRYFNVFGPRQVPDSPYAAVIPRFISALLRGEPPVIYGDGKQTRDFVFVEDVARANLLAATGKRASGEVINVGTGKPIPVNDATTLLNKYLGTELQPEYHPNPITGYVYKHQADTTKAAKLIGFRAKVPFAKGLKLLIKCYE